MHGVFPNCICLIKRKNVVPKTQPCMIIVILSSLKNYILININMNSRYSSNMLWRYGDPK